MKKNSKTLSRIANKPTAADIRWEELKSALEFLGYELIKGSGSRRKFHHKERDLLISLHEPHPQPNVCKGAIEDVREHLRMHGFID